MTTLDADVAARGRPERRRAVEDFPSPLVDRLLTDITSWWAANGEGVDLALVPTDRAVPGLPAAGGPGAATIQGTVAQLTRWARGRGADGWSPVARSLRRGGSDWSPPSWRPPRQLAGRSRRAAVESRAADPDDGCTTQDHPEPPPISDGSQR